MRVGVLVFVVIAAKAAVAQQSTVVHGRVTAADTGSPLANATVALSAPIGQRAVRTRADGTFDITVAETRLALTITKPGYVRTAVSQPRVPGQLNVSLARAGALTVYVVNAAGEPMPGGSGFAICDVGNGARGGGSLQVDDLGRARVTARAGECVVGAEPPMMLTSSAVPGIQGAVPVNMALRMADRERNGVRVTIRAGEESAVTIQQHTPDRTAVGDTPGFTGSGSIRGRVMARANRPVPNAMVQASSGALRSVTFTDQDGAYEFSRLPAGTFDLVLRAPGFVRLDPASPRIPLETGQQAVADFTVVKGGVITGTVLDEYGEPEEGVMVSATPASATAVSTAALLSIPTDDRGRYRIAGLPTGAYRVVARISRDGVDNALFYPGRNSPADAVEVPVALESETPGIDFGGAPSAAGALTGKVTMSTGAVPGGAVVRLLQRGSGATSAQPRTASVGRAGDFSFPEVAAGTYELSVTAGSAYVIVTRRSGQVVPAPTPPPTEFSRMDITVSGSSMAPIAVTTFPGSRVQGRLVFEGERGTALPSAFRLAALGDSSTWAVPDANGAFQLQDLSTATRIGLTQAPPGWYLKTLTIGGINAADDPVDFSRGANSSSDVRAVIAKTSSITGRVGDPANVAGSSAITVVAFPVEPERRYAQSRYVRWIRPKEDGTFTLDVPPGQYWVAAVAGATPSALNGATLEQLSRLSAVLGAPPPIIFPPAILQQLERLSVNVFAGDAGGRAELRVVPMPR